ncbi:MAG: xylulokinase [Microthrixaceae bacterium]
MNEPLVLGVDSSTGSTKVEARTLAEGDLVGVGRAAHPGTEPPRSEQDPMAWWSALVDAVGQLGDLRASVVAVSVAAQQHGLVVTDAAGKPIRAAKLWNDTESAAVSQAMLDALGPHRWVEACGSVPLPAFTITKLGWLAEHEPEVLARTERVFLPHDWLTYVLCGAHVTDRGDASGTGWFDPASGAMVAAGFLERALGVIGVPVQRFDADPCGWLRDRVPAVLDPLSAAGRITATAAGELGLDPGVVVGPGTGDNMAAALGLGLAPGDVVVSLGTSGTVYARSTVRTTDATGAVAGFADATGMFLPLVCTLNATKVTDTVARWLGVDLDTLSDLALAADPSAPGRPTLVPYFDGERTPNLPHATGSLEGLRTTTTREDLALAAHDGVLRGLLAGRDALAAAGVDVDGALILVGGGARSEAYRQRLADLARRTVVVPQEAESVAAGAAVQAAAVAEATASARNPGEVAQGAPPDTGHGSASTAIDAPPVRGPFDAVASRWRLGRGQTTAARG